MCSLAGAASLLSTGLSVAGSVISYNDQKKQAYNQWLSNVQQELHAEKYRGQLLEYQNTTYKQDIEHGFNVLDYQKNEFDRQAKTIDRATESIDKGRFNQYGQLLLRQVQEHVATTLGMDDVRRQGRKMAASGEAAAASRGVEGVTVDQIIGDVARQEGEAVTVLEMNNTGVQHQLNMEMQGVKATADQRIFDIPMATYAPSAVTRQPAPVSPTAPAVQPPMPSGSALVANVGSSLLTGLNSYSKWSGTSLNDMFKIR
ncbi:virion core protein, T7 gp14 family [Camelimonas lactis]|uniref:Uncharacterized protein n=1 Tax=Camelimonas lactis TaxID=659006 RepID=A0A4R2GTV2_9HYPH|nr:hypothetical protein [Camelimonas lactis]TCO14070.1 hypothetical protein EV666_10420 [Camelimonas lactis]